MLKNFLQTQNIILNEQQVIQLESYTELLLKWNPKINLIGKSTQSDIYSRHILDCLQLRKYIPEDARVITDLGSGAGLPGLILAAFGYEINLVESDQRKCSFLYEAANIFPNKINIHNKRIENCEPWDSDVLTSRALANLANLLNLSQDFIKKSKLTLFMKGENVVQEIEEATKCWKINYKIHPSITNKNSTILEVTEISKEERCK